MYYFEVIRTFVKVVAVFSFKINEDRPLMGIAFLIMILFGYYLLINKMRPFE